MYRTAVTPARCALSRFDCGMMSIFLILRPPRSKTPTLTQEIDETSNHSNNPTPIRPRSVKPPPIQVPTTSRPRMWVRNRRRECWLFPIHMSQVRHSTYRTSQELEETQYEELKEMPNRSQSFPGNCRILQYHLAIERLLGMGNNMWGTHTNKPSPAYIRSEAQNRTTYTSNTISCYVHFSAKLHYT